MHLTNSAGKVVMLVRSDRLTASRIAIDKVNEPGSRIEVRYNAMVAAIEGAAASISIREFLRRSQ